MIAMMTAALFNLYHMLVIEKLTDGALGTSCPLKSSSIPIRQLYIALMRRNLSLKQAVCIRTRRKHAQCTHIQHENNTCLFFKLSCNLEIKVTKTDMKAYRKSKVTIMQNSKECTNLNTRENINHCCCCTRKCFKEVFQKPEALCS